MCNNSFAPLLHGFANCTACNHPFREFCTLTQDCNTTQHADSLARVFVSQPGQEPWLTLGYDEWIYCCSGRLVFGLPDGSTVELKAGETALVDKGTRFQPRFPEAGTSYIPVCIPAFRPDRCVREEGSCSDVAKRLAALHTKVEDAPEVLYHMVCFPCLSFWGRVDGVFHHTVRAASLGGRQRVGRGLLPADV